MEKLTGDIDVGPGAAEEAAQGVRRKLALRRISVPPGLSRSGRYGGHDGAPTDAPRRATA